MYFKYSCLLYAFCGITFCAFWKEISWVNIFVGGEFDNMLDVTVSEQWVKHKSL